MSDENSLYYLRKAARQELAVGLEVIETYVLALTSFWLVTGSLVLVIFIIFHSDYF